ncbi:hypothetical protein [Veronia pacifica]|uniref:Uncharacterized protein n=2 Tax=Veronia pacifica TaxID=1080227 RepID=A0A1C3E993_9GAMM|nr:hypothetical protein [Veronia pacifica]ODA29815.1 hypothetical protein A8L45_21700 [Veronia pacifica]
MTLKEGTINMFRENTGVDYKSALLWQENMFGDGLHILNSDGRTYTTMDRDFENGDEFFKLLEKHLENGYTNPVNLQVEEQEETIYYPLMY